MRPVSGPVQVGGRPRRAATALLLRRASARARALAEQGAPAESIGQQVGFALIGAPCPTQREVLRRLAGLSRRGVLPFSVHAARGAIADVDAFRREAMGR
jgi:hypothetical protein